MPRRRGPQPLRRRRFTLSCSGPAGRPPGHARGLVFSSRPAVACMPRSLQPACENLTCIGAPPQHNPRNGSCIRLLSSNWRITHAPCLTCFLCCTTPNFSPLLPRQYLTCCPISPRHRHTHVSQRCQLGSLQPVSYPCQTLNIPRLQSGRMCKRGQGSVQSTWHADGGELEDLRGHP